MIQALLTICCAYFFQQFEKSEWDWNLIAINGIALYCSTSSTYVPLNNGNRILFAVVLYGSMVFDTIFLAIALAGNTLYSYQVSTVEEIVADGYRLTGDQFAFMHALKQNEVKHFFSSKTHKKIIFVFFRYFRQNSFGNFKYATIQILV